MLGKQRKKVKMLTLMYITNRPDIALIAERSGVDLIFIDLEILGKQERQGHLDTVISRHRPEDVAVIRKVLTTARLLVRINPIHAGSSGEISRVIDAGAQILMLPYFKTMQEAETFLRLADGRAETCLLCETPEAVACIDEILALRGIDYIHVGLNDLHLGYGMKFMFELLTDGTVEQLCRKFAKREISYGFGGIARLGQGTLPAEYIIAEHYRLGSGMAILSRSFLNTGITTDATEAERIFSQGVREIREYEGSLRDKDQVWFEENRLRVRQLVDQIAGKTNTL